HSKGSLLFCPDCGTLLSLPNEGETTVLCELCDYEEPASSYDNFETTTRSHPEAFPSALRQKRKTQTKRHETYDQGTLVSEKCPACGYLQAYSKEMQLRSADEGSTIFYTCASCKHGWRVNN
ncbi:DNA-directed RNA polymerase I kDa polypeptide, partial [Amanita muscaria]